MYFFSFPSQYYYTIAHLTFYTLDLETYLQSILLDVLFNKNYTATRRILLRIRTVRFRHNRKGMYVLQVTLLNCSFNRRSPLPDENSTDKFMQLRRCFNSLRSFLSISTETQILKDTIKFLFKYISCIG